MAREERWTDEATSAPAVAGRWHHSSLAVHDLDASTRFYGSAFGYRPLFEACDVRELAPCTGLAGATGDLVQLALPGDDHVLELIAFRGVPEGREDDAPVRVGHGHVSFLADDFDAALRAVLALGATPVGEVTRFAEGRAAYLREPGGSVFEIDEASASPDGGAPVA